MDIYFYRVSWSWYEEYSPKVFYHTKKYSEQEFNDLIRRLSNEAGKELASREAGHFVGNTQIIERVWELLLGEGFKEVKYTQSYDMWGSCIICGEDDMLHYSKYLDADTLKLLDDYNLKIKKKTWEDVGFG